MIAIRPKVKRWWKRTLAAAGLVALVGATWFLFLPVPLGWAARLALRVTLPPGAAHARVQIDRVTFRFGGLQPSVRLDLDGIAVESAAGGQLARSIEHVEVRFAKRALWRRNWAPSLIEVSKPVLIVDLTKPPAAAPLPPAPKPTSRRPSPSLAVRTAALRAFIPLPDNPCRFVVRQPSVDVKTPGRVAHWLFQDIDTAFSRQGDHLRFEFPVALANARRPVALTCRMDGALQTGLIDFSVGMAQFSSEDLPPVPLIPGESERSEFRIAFRLDGKLRLDQLKLEEINFSFLGDHGQFHLPKVKSTPIHVQRVEIRGRAREDFRFVHFDAAVLLLDSLRLDASGLDVETGPAPRLNAHIVVTGPTGADIAAYLPPAVAASLPFPADALRQLRIESVNLDVTGSARIGPDGRFATQTLAGDGRINLDLNGERVPLSVNARIEGAGQPIRAHVSAPEINPAQLRLAVLAPFAPLAVLDAPVRLDAEATATTSGELHTAMLNLKIGHGRLRAFGPIAKDLNLKSAAAEAEFSEGGRALHVSGLRLELDGPVFSARDLTARLSPSGVLTVRGDAQFEDISGEFLARLGPNALLAALTAIGLDPRALHATELAGSFSAQARPAAKDIWPTVAATFDETAHLEIREEPLAVAVNGVLDGASDAIRASVKVAEFRPARLRLSLPGGLASSVFDFPAKLQARAVAGLRSAQRSVDVSLTAGTGVMHANPFFDGELPITAFTCDAAFDGALDNFVLRSLHADLGGLLVRADGVNVKIAAKPAVSGSLEIKDATIERILRVWPATLQPELRRQMADAVKAGEVTRAALRFAALVNLEAPAESRLDELAGDIGLDGLRLELPRAPGPLALGNLAIAVKYPGLAATLASLSAPGLSLTNATLRTADLLAPVPRVEIAAAFGADLSAAAAWLEALNVAPPSGLPLNLAKLAGTASGDLRASLPLSASLDLAAMDAMLQARIDGLIVPLTYPGARLGGGQVIISAHALRGQLSTALDWRELDLVLPDVLSGRLTLHVDAARPRPDAFDLHASLDASHAQEILRQSSTAPAVAPLTFEAHIAGWNVRSKTRAEFSAASPEFLGGPLALAAEATVLNSTTHLESASIPRLRLGRTNLSAEYSNPASGRYVLSIKGPRLDLDELLRLAAPFLGGPAPAALNRVPARPAPPARRGLAAATSGGQRPDGPRSAATPTPSAEQKGAPPLFPDLKASVAIDAVEFGGGRSVRDLSMSTRIIDDLPRELSLQGREDGANPLTFMVTPKGDHQEVRLTIADATAWLRTLLQPLRGVELPPDTMTAMADNLAQFPVLFSGGRFELDGDLRLRRPDRLFDGQFKLTDTVIRQPPRVLQLIALKSGKRLRESPLIKEFSASRLFVSDKLVALEGIKSDAASLAYLKLNFIRYGLADETLHLDGRYAGVGFEVLGTRANPQVFLKDNLLIRAIGSDQEFAFGDPPAAPPPPPRQD
ncbi:MAG TPA: hypothetical protein VLW52_03225 [Opitutaceae bacterium]|nr:hypothetical protein [Opitutaceae bacterium]